MNHSFSSLCFAHDAGRSTDVQFRADCKPYRKEAGTGRFAFSDGAKGVGELLAIVGEDLLKFDRAGFDQAVQETLRGTGRSPKADRIDIDILA